MNEFTKDELEEIVGGLSYFINRNPDYDTELFEKIQSMIDNYCDHECTGEIEIFIDTCSKCKAYLLREKHYDE